MTDWLLQQKPCAALLAYAHTHHHQHDYNHHAVFSSRAAGLVKVHADKILTYKHFCVSQAYPIMNS